MAGGRGSVAPPESMPGSHLKEEPAGSDHLAERVRIKLPCLSFSAGKGKILYKPIFKWESKLTAVLFINSCMDEKCVFPWYFSKTVFVLEVLHACPSSLNCMVTFIDCSDKQQ